MFSDIFGFVMKDVYSQIDQWSKTGIRTAVARVVGLKGSGPRDPGATMVMNDRGEVVGSVSGGCVEGAVVLEGEALLAGHRAPGVVSFGYSDDDAFAVGLTCGGTISIFLDIVEPSPNETWGAIVSALRSNEPIALATVIAKAIDEGPTVGESLIVKLNGDHSLSFSDRNLARVVTRDAKAFLEAGVTTTRHYGAGGEANRDDLEVFIESFVPAPRLIIFGAVDFTAALAAAGKLLGYHVTVCDAREVFSTPARFPMADEVVCDWPQRYLESIVVPLTPRDAVCVLTHDMKFDVPAIVSALNSEVGYLGAMGSRKTHEKRIERLREAGVGEEGIERVMAPIGIDLGARTPEETAIAICAEMIATRTGRSVPSLRDGTGSIH